jgi:thioesterase domain-containing protein
MYEANQSSPIAAMLPPGRRNVVLLQSGDLRKPAFFVHASDGDVVSYLQLARELRGAAQTYGITAIDLDLKTLLPGSVQEIAEYYSEQVCQIVRHGPIRLVGWSSGAWIAFEMANALQRRGEAVSSVTVLDAPPPDPS